MSLSRFYKNQGEFVPEKLVPRPPKETDNWKPVTISEDEDDAMMPEKDLTISPAAHELEQTTIPADEPIYVPPPSAQKDTEVPEAPPTAHSPPPPDLDKIREESFQKGFEEGMKQSDLDYGNAAKALAQACELINSIRETILKNSRGEMLDLVIALSEKIIRHSVTEQDDTIIATVKEAIDQAVKSSEFQVYLNPEDLKIIEKRSPELVSMVSGLEKLVVKADRSIERGGCTVESENCTVDATLASQFDVIHKKIKEL